MGTLQKVAVFVLFLGSFAVQYRALAASVFATPEVRAGRSVGIWQVIRAVRRKQLRLFWTVMLASLVTGPFGMIVFPIPSFAVAILENKPAFAAIKRGDALAKGRHGRIALLVLLWMGVAVAAVFAWISFLIMLGERFSQPWFLWPVSILGFWLILLIPQVYMIALTLNYLERLEREGEIGMATRSQADSSSEHQSSGG